MYYRERQDPMSNKDGEKLWRPEIVRTGKMVNSRELSKLISTATTLTQSDIAAVLYSLPLFMNVHLREGHTVRLDGVGTFTVYGRSKGNGVLNKKDVRPSQFGTLNVKFTPEYTVSVGGTRAHALLDGIDFVHVDRLAKGLAGGSDEGGDSGSGGGVIDPDA